MDHPIRLKHFKNNMERNLLTESFSIHLKGLNRRVKSLLH